MNGLVADLRVVRPGGFRLAAGLHIDRGETVALLGPNGAGKSTVVLALAGLLPVDGGVITLGDETLDRPSTGTFVPAERRRIGVVFQDYALFPHLTALDNVAFGLEVHGRSRSGARREASTWLDKVGLGEAERIRPGELSGGQAQRVALARALAFGPDLLLLDEPLAALDATTRPALRAVLAEHLEGFEGPRLLITHDPLEAFVLADRIYVIEHGAITQTGTADDIRLRPRSPYAADLGGTNLFVGTAAGGHLDVGGHRLSVADHTVSGPAIATVHPRAISLHRRPPEGSPRNAWETSVRHLEPLGERVRVQLGTPLPITAEITPASAAELGLEADVKVWISIKATEISIEAQP